MKEKPQGKSLGAIGGSVQRMVKVRPRIMLLAYAKVVESITHLNTVERRRVIKAANITCGESP